MEGVIILDTFETVVGHQPAFGFASWLCLIGFIVFFIMGIIATYNCWSEAGFFGFIAVVCFTAMLLFTMLANPIKETRYEAYIFPNVNLGDLQEHYEVVGKDGGCYILREVDNEELPN